MSKPNKDGQRTNFYLEKKLVTELDEFCKRTGRTKTGVAEIALKEYLKRHRNEK